MPTRKHSNFNCEMVDETTSPVEARVLQLVPISRRDVDVTCSGSEVDFRLVDSHSYLATADVGSFDQVPTQTAFTPPEPGGYEIRGHVTLSGNGRAALYLLQYDKDKQLAKDSVSLRPGPFRLRWRASAECQWVLIALRLSGEGRLRLAPLKLQRDTGLPLEAELAQIDRGQPRTRIFIAGCPRSGTTLLLNMMRCFDNVAVDLSERSWNHFALFDEKPPIHVLKRTGHCWQTLTDIPGAVSIIYLVRHPYDVLTSRHRGDLGKGYFTTVDEWLAEYQAFRQLESTRPAGDVLVIRYEDLVQHPDQVQRQIQEWAPAAPLDVALPFDRFHEIASERENLYQVALSGVRPPDTSSIKKWQRDKSLRHDLRHLIAQAPAEIASFVERFGYDSDH